MGRASRERWTLSHVACSAVGAAPEAGSRAPAQERPADAQRCGGGAVESSCPGYSARAVREAGTSYGSEPNGDHREGLAMPLPAEAGDA